MGNPLAVGAVVFTRNGRARPAVLGPQPFEYGAMLSGVALADNDSRQQRDVDQEAVSGPLRVGGPLHGSFTVDGTPRG